MYAKVVSLFWLCLCSPIILWGQGLPAYSIDSLAQEYRGLELHVSIYIDSTQALELSHVQQLLAQGVDSAQKPFQSFVPLKNYQESLSLPYAYWGHIALTNHSGKDQNFHLGIYADYTDIYLLRNNQAALHYPTGRFRPSTEMEDKDNRYGIVVSIEEEETVHLYFRNYSINHYEVLMRPFMRDPLYVEQRISEHNVYQGFFQGILWIMLLYNLLTFFSTRDKSYLYYVGYLLSGSIYFLYLYGFLHKLLTHPVPKAESYLWMLSVYGSTLFYAFFTRSYFHTKERVPKADKVIIWWIRAEVVMLAIVLGIIAWNHNIQLVRSINLGVTLAGTIVSLWVVWQLRVIKNPVFTLFIIGAFTYLCSVIIFFYGLTLSGWGWISPVSGLTLSYIVEAGLVTEILCFSMGLSYRLKINEEDKRHAKEELIIQLEAHRRYQEQANQELEGKVIARTTEIKNQKEEIAAQKENLQLQKEQLEVQFLELSELNEEKNHLMGVLAHDLRNPLTSLLTVANLLKSEKELLHDDHIEYVDLLLRSLDRMAEMIQRTLDERAIEAKKTAIKLEPVNVCEVVNSVANAFMSKAAQKQLLLECQEYLSEGSEGLWVRLDKQYLIQVMENLISNALKYSPQGKKVWITLHNNQGKARVAIKDQGPGISSEDKPKLFRKFQKLSARPTAGESSTGLGLSIVKKYVDLMKGRVWCETPEEGGSVFWVEFNVISDSTEAS